MVLRAAAHEAFTTLNRTRLYLDVDGVLRADGSKWGPVSTVVITERLPGAQTYREHVTYSPTLVRALESLIDTFDVELVWLTTWIENGIILELPRAIDALHFGRCLPMPARNGFAGELARNWKRDAILCDLADHNGPYIWIDDDDVPFDGETVSAQFPRPSLMIAPDPFYGITPAELTDFRRFLVTVSS